MLNAKTPDPYQDPNQMRLDLLVNPGMTDKLKILDWFSRNKTLTCVEAIHKLGIYNLRSRACEIPGISSAMIEVTRLDGVRTRVAQYSMGAA